MLRIIEANQMIILMDGDGKENIMKSIHFYNITDKNTVKYDGEGSLIPDYVDFEDFALNYMKATKIEDNKYKLPNADRYISLEESTYYDKDINYYHTEGINFIPEYIQEKYKDQIINKSNTSNKNNGRFEIWIEGYQASGDSAPPQCIGVGYGKNFKEACKELASRDEEFKKCFNASRMTYWGCRLFQG